MARKKLTITASTEQLDQLKKALRVGTPISIALSMVGISLATYIYWVAVYSVVEYCKEQEELETLEKLTKAGISIQEIKDMTAATTHGHAKSGINTYIEPKQEAILQYKHSKKFREFADQVYEIVSECNRIRSDVVVRHLSTIVASTESKNRIKASGSMWFLERTLTDYFGKPSDKVIQEETTPNTIPSIQVEFVDPGDTASKDRLAEMEQKVLSEMKGSGDA